VRIRHQQQFLFAVFLLLLGGLGLGFGWHLSMGTALRMGPGYLPKVLSVILIIYGIGLTVSSLSIDAPPIGRWPWRGIAIVLGSLCLFGLMVERAGLLLTTVAVTLVATAAAPDRRWREAAIFAVAIAAFCAIVFRGLLSLPLPVLPG
jgi:hypothetical protein